MGDVGAAAKANWLVRNGLWDRYCELTRTNIWAMNDGLLTGEEILTLPEEMLGETIAAMQREINNHDGKKAI